MAALQIGVYGLGTMGAALALNMADNGIRIGVANRNADVIPAFLERAGDLQEQIEAHNTLEALVAALPQPRLLLAMIPSTGPMDSFLDQVIPLLAEGDTVIDAGNADFHDTRRRTARLNEHGLHFVGLGVSGGEEGARRGPSMMMGGAVDSWERLQPILTAVAAKHKGEPCVDRMGPDGAGHFVKTVHNGIEYADMQMLAEVFDLTRNGLGYSTQQISEMFGRWNKGALESYLVEISSTVLSYDEDGAPFVDKIVDSAGQKGTGRWTVIEAVKLGQSATAIEAAVAGRAWSAEKAVRLAAEEAFGNAREAISLTEEDLEKAMLAARILEYAQGFRILAAASAEYDWNLDPARIAEIWRAGCIIRARLLDDISAAFRDGAPEGQLMLAPSLRPVLEDGLPALRRVVGQAVAAGYPVPVFSAALTFYDTIRQGRGTASLIQAQRDFFGYHGFERVDRDAPGQHGPWWN